MEDYDEDFGSEASEEEIEMGTADVLNLLEQSWLNEKFAPELLENKQELIDCMLEQIDQMEENINSCKKGDIRIILHKMELYRIRYVISSYLRIRLNKIERYVKNILENEDSNPKLSTQELAYAKEYLENIESHFTSSVLKNIPPKVQTLEKSQSGPSPNLDSYIFFRARENCDKVLIEDEEESSEPVDLAEGSQFLMRYRSVMTLLEASKIALI